MRIKEHIVKKICQAMNYTLLDFRTVYEQAISEVNDNGIRPALWAKRADILTHDFEPDEEIKVLHVKRGNLWQIDPVADLENGDLYVLMSRKNLKERIKEAKRKQFSTHYLYSLILKNSYIKVKQQEELALFPIYSKEEQEEHVAYRKEDCERILRNYNEKINRIVVIAVDYVAEIATTACAYVFDDKYNVFDSLDVSDYLLPAEYESTGSSVDKEKQVEIQQPIVKLKLRKKAKGNDK